MLEERMLKIAKETDDVIVCAVELVKCIKKKGDYASLVDDLIVAVDGVGQISEEMKHTKEFINTIGSRIGDFVDAFSSKEDEKA